MTAATWLSYFVLVLEWWFDKVVIH